MKNVGIGGAATGGVGAVNPRLSRRWSLDNLSPAHAAAAAGGDGREGYVRDLRKQHTTLTSIKDEEYPLMLTEKGGGLGGDDASGSSPAAKRAVTPPRLLLHGRHRSGSVDVDHLKV